MRIIIDLQSLQTASRERGIGRYSLALARAMIAEGERHDWFVAMNHAFPDTVDDVRESLATFLPQENILLFQVPTPVAGGNPENHWRCRSAELVREQFLQQLRPDWVHVTSLFEGLGDEAVTSVGALPGLPTAVTLYDLIPYFNQEHYFQDQTFKTWYLQKVAYLRQAELLLAISGHSRQDAMDALGISGDKVVNISADADASFRVTDPDQGTRDRLAAQYRLRREFVMYTGGIEYRKNIERLIEAYAQLAAEVRAAHQLVIVCKVQVDARRRLMKLAADLGLGPDELVLTGYVSDEDLVAFYNLCKVFVFPSMHEGFGLPALEAMRCGAPVIGSNRTSIPEVIGLEEALFDPFSIASIKEKLFRALTDGDFRQRLRQHGRVQAGKFSWQVSARMALSALEAAFERRQADTARATVVSIPVTKPRLAYISPLPPEKSGIADYSAELLPELARYYNIDLITDLPQTSDPWLDENLRLRTVAQFKASARDYDRILYHFGNSAFHSHMFALLAQHPGTVVLHDFFLSGVLQHIEVYTEGSLAFRQAVYRSHGYPALWHWRIHGAESTVWAYPASLEVLQAAQGVIVHSDYAIHLATCWFGWETQGRLVRIPQLHYPAAKIDRAAARRELGLPNDAFVICSFGVLGHMKLNDVLLDAWLASDLARLDNCYLIFAGDGQGNDYERSLSQRVKASEMSKRVRITGYITPEVYENYLAVADVAVQLRARSRGETSRAVLDCLAHGAPTVVNDHGSMAELPTEAVIKLPDKFTASELARMLERLFREPDLRKAMGNAAMRYVHTELDPAVIGARYAQAIEAFAANQPVASRHRLLLAIRALSNGKVPPSRDLVQTAAAIAENIPPSGKRKLLIDISEFVKCNAKTGIQRVVWSILGAMTQNDATYRVEPVYRSGGLYRYGRRFMEKLVGIGQLGLDDVPADVACGDLFLGLDLDPEIDEEAIHWLQHQVRRGMRLYFVVYDLLPLLKPESFPHEGFLTVKTWLETVVGLADGLICISRSVATELGQWLDGHPVERRRPLSIGYFHLGSEIGTISPGAGLSESERALLNTLSNETGILMVGTIEPRKGHIQALNAFEVLWRLGENAVLIIVGKQGWMMEEFMERLRRHPQGGRRLFWCDQASDSLLNELYRKAAVLLMASDGEGFGLPLVEAARQGLPIIARDLPVFQEIAGDNAFYFHGTDANALALALKEWLDLYRRGRHPRSEGIQCLNWQESARQLEQVLFDGHWLATWEPGCGFLLNNGECCDNGQIEAAFTSEKQIGAGIAGDIANREK
jgi:glycosyltransferase involved in cell wall biosynthesis